MIWLEFFHWLVGTNRRSKNKKNNAMDRNHWFHWSTTVEQLFVHSSLQLTSLWSVHQSVHRIVSFLMSQSSRIESSNQVQSRSQVQSNRVLCVLRNWHARYFFTKIDLVSTVRARVRTLVYPSNRTLFGTVPGTLLYSIHLTSLFTHSSINQHTGPSGTK